MVATTGIEPVTLGLWVPRSNQLSYVATSKIISRKLTNFNDLLVGFLPAEDLNAALAHSKMFC